MKCFTLLCLVTLLYTGTARSTLADGEVIYEFSVYRTRDLKEMIASPSQAQAIRRRELLGGRLTSDHSFRANGRCYQARFKTTGATVEYYVRRWIPNPYINAEEEAKAKAEEILCQGTLQIKEDGLSAKENWEADEYAVVITKTKTIR